jgi:hypothetical protein
MRKILSLAAILVSTLFTMPSVASKPWANGGELPPKLEMTSANDQGPADRRLTIKQKKAQAGAKAVEERLRIERLKQESKEAELKKESVESEVSAAQEVIEENKAKLQNLAQVSEVDTKLKDELLKEKQRLEEETRELELIKGEEVQEIKALFTRKQELARSIKELEEKQRAVVDSYEKSKSEGEQGLLGSQNSSFSSPSSSPATGQNPNNKVAQVSPAGGANSNNDASPVASVPQQPQVNAGADLDPQKSQDNTAKPPVPEPAKDVKQDGGVDPKAVKNDGDGVPKDKDVKDQVKEKSEDDSQKKKEAEKKLIDEALDGAVPPSEKEGWGAFLWTAGMDKLYGIAGTAGIMANNAVTKVMTSSEDRYANDRFPNITYSDFLTFIRDVMFKDKKRDTVDATAAEFAKITVRDFESCMPPIQFQSRKGVEYFIPMGVSFGKMTIKINNNSAVNILESVDVSNGQYISRQMFEKYLLYLKIANEKNDLGPYLSVYDNLQEHMNPYQFYVDMRKYIIREDKDNEPFFKDIQFLKRPKIFGGKHTCTSIQMSLLAYDTENKIPLRFTLFGYRSKNGKNGFEVSDYMAFHQKMRDSGAVADDFK